MISSSGVPSLQGQDDLMTVPGADLGGGCRGCAPPPNPRDDLRFSNTTGILQTKKTMLFIGVEVEQETSAPPPKKNPGSPPAVLCGIYDATTPVKDTSLPQVVEMITISLWIRIASEKNVVAQEWLAQCFLLI